MIRTPFGAFPFTIVLPAKKACFLPVVSTGVV